MSEANTINRIIYPWQQEQWDLMLQAVDQQRLPHAMLFTGETGVGKADFAAHLAGLLLCLSPENNKACGKCHACSLLAAETHPDLDIVSPEDSNVIKVDQIRQLVEKNALTPHISMRKIYLLIEAEKMNSAASNSLLKTLEEPSSNTLIILVTARPDLLSATIRSRCQQIKFNKPGRQDTLDWLSTFELTQTPEKLLNIVSGGPLAALQLDRSGEAELYDEVFADFGRVIFGKSDPIKVAEQWQKNDLERIFNWLAIWVIDIIRLKFDNDSPLIKCADKHKGLLKIAGAFQQDQLFAIYNQQLKAMGLLQKTINKTLLVENFLVSCITDR